MGENFVELAADGALAGRVSPALDVGGILKQREHAFFAVLGEGVEVEELVVGGRGIDFEVAGMNHHPERAMDSERDTIHQTVRHLDGMDGERAQFDSLIRAQFVEVGVIQQSVLVEFVFHIGERELRSPDGDFEFGKHPGQGADMVLVAVREDDAANALAIFEQVRDVGHDDVDTQEFGFGEHEPGVDDDDVISPAEGHAVHTELAKAAERNDLQFSSGHAVRRMLARAGGEYRVPGCE